MISCFPRNRMRLFTGLRMTVLFLVFSFSLQANEKTIEPPSSCVNVKVGSYLIDLLKIDDAEQLFNADVIVRIVWEDMTTIFASALIIGCMAWMVFWMPMEAINPRISISVTSMLTLIAHRFVAGSQLPKLSYLTNMDYFLLSCTIMVLLSLVAVVTLSRLSSCGRPDFAFRLNRFFRWLYPMIFIGVIMVLT